MSVAATLAPQAVTLADTGAPVVISPLVFRAFRSFAQDALRYGNNHHALRNGIAALQSTFRSEARRQYGHETTVEVVALSGLLRRTNPQLAERGLLRPPVEMDVVQELEYRHELDSGQAHAALQIREIWRAWGRYLDVSGQAFERRGGVRRASALNPVLVMGQDLWELYISRYRPWYDKTSRKLIVHTTSTRLTVPDLVFKMVVENQMPEHCDQRYAFKAGSSLKVLKHQLNAYTDLVPLPLPPEETAND